MKLILQGHNRYAAVEQALLNYFPDRPEGEAVSRLSEGAVWTTATARIRVGDRTFVGISRVRTGTGQTDHVLKQAFYKAARPHLRTPPPWGSLTGIRPAKLASQIAGRGEDPETVLREAYHVFPDKSRLAAECAHAAMRTERTLMPGDVSLYVGIPFCPTRCAYCSFVSNAVEKSGHLVEPYLERLAEELALLEALALRLRLTVTSVYVGGGTPTALTAAQLERLCEALAWASPKEYTVEAGRPDSITEEKLKILRRFRVGRISVNPQTMHDKTLRLIGRRHTAEQTRNCFRLAREAGFDCVNTDLIAGLPGETPEDFEQTLDEVLSWTPENITVHTLARKKGARWETEGNPAGQGVERMLTSAGERLRAGGYTPYYLYRQKFTAGGFENTGWCRPGTEGLYNLCMMEELHTVLSAGAGGVTKLVDKKRNRIERSFHCKFPLEYLQKCDKMLCGIEYAEKFLGETV